MFNFVRKQRKMKRSGLSTRICTVLISLVFILPGNGQNKTQTKDSIREAKVIPDGQSKVKKNYFIRQYPQEFFCVQCGLQDRAGNMWFGASADGIYIYDGKSFSNFTRNDGLCHNDMLCCLEDKAGNIWFGTRNGLIRYKPSDGPPRRNNFTSFLISANTISKSSRAKLPYNYAVADNFVWSILEDKSGKIWFSTGKGVYVHNPLVDYDGDTPLFTQFLDNDSLINKNNLHLKDVLSMAQDKEGNIWFASGYMEGEGICYYDGRSLTNFKPDSLSSFRSIIKEKNGNLLFLNLFHGVYFFDGKTFINYSHKIGLKNDTIVAIREDRAGNLWFGTNSDNIRNGGDGGVWRYDGNSLKLFTTKDGLSHNCVFSIVEDKMGNIWFGTRNTGLCRYDGKTFIDFTE
jgi:ligand-binding sensor domain-containing protein